MAVINDSADSWLHAVRRNFIRRLREEEALSGACHITGRRRKGKGLVGLFRFNYYCGSTKDPALSRDLAFIFVIMLIPPATKRDQAFIRDRP